METRNFPLLLVLSACCLFLLGCDRGLTANNLTTQPDPNSISSAAPPNGTPNSSNPTTPSNPAPSVQPSQFLYVATDKMTTFPCCGSSYESILQAFRIDPQTGAIANVGSIQTDPAPQSMVRSPSDLSFYAAGAHEEEVVGYTVDPGSGVPQISSIAGRFNPGIEAAITPDGKFVYSIAASINTYAIQAGNLSLLRQFSPDGNRLTQNDWFEQGIISPNGKFLFALAANGSHGDHQVVSLAIGSDGSLSPTSTLDLALTGISPKGWIVDNSSTYLYAFVGSENAIRTFRIDSKDGSLPETSNSPQPLGLSTGGDITISPRNILYVAARNALAAYSINATTGALALLGSAPCQSAVDISVDRSGDFIYVASYEPSNIFAFSLDERGVPHPVQGSPFPIILDSGAHLTALLAD